MATKKKHIVELSEESIAAISGYASNLFEDIEAFVSDEPTEDHKEMAKGVLLGSILSYFTVDMSDSSFEGFLLLVRELRARDQAIEKTEAH